MKVDVLECEIKWILFDGGVFLMVNVICGIIVLVVYDFVDKIVDIC